MASLDYMDFFSDLEIQTSEFWAASMDTIFIGQDVDRSYGRRFAHTSFSGEITGFQLWNETLSPESITSLSQCSNIDQVRREEPYFLGSSIVSYLTMSL